jgi:hypothetical protein
MREVNIRVKNWDPNRSWYRVPWYAVSATCRKIAQRVVPDLAHRMGESMREERENGSKEKQWHERVHWPHYRTAYSSTPGENEIWTNPCHLCM